MNSEFLTALNEIAEEKGLDKDEVLKMIEASLAAAFRKDYGEKDINDMLNILFLSKVLIRVEITKEEHLEAKKGESISAAENRLLDILIPPVKKSPSFDNTSEVEIEEPDDEERLNIPAFLRRGN